MEAWNAIVVGSGIGGLTCAAALARSGHRVLVLERHAVAGGLTQTFSRDGFTWNVGMHYLGEMGPGGGARRVLDWLCDGAIDMAPLGSVYDTVHFPDGFDMAFSRPEAALRQDLADQFPESTAQIDAFFAALAEGERAGRAIFTQRALPRLLGRMHRFWFDPDVKKWWGRTTAEVAREMVHDPWLRAVLLAQRGDYGDPSEASSFGIHAMVMRHYFNGAHYPVGGGKVFAWALVPVIERGGGEVRLNAEVAALIVDGGRVVGARLVDGSEHRAEHVFSDAGALNTVGRLLPADMRASDWAREVLSLKSSVCHIGMYLGLEGDIRAHGATASNHWFYDSWDLDAGTWRDPDATPAPPAMFVSFPTLKDPSHVPGEKRRHTAEIVVMTHWSVFSRWADSRPGERPPDYTAFKARLERGMLAHFARRFPGVAPMIVNYETSTPLTTTAFTGAPEGAIYGVETSPRRFLSDCLHAKTPIPGLLLTGQDVTCPGVGGAMMGGMLAAASIEPRVFAQIS